MTASEGPAVSVVMCVRDGMPYVSEAIASVRDQSFQEFEFIVVDDGSRDGTPALLTEVAAADPRVRTVFHDGTRGWVAAVNAGCRLARGSYIARLDADDVCLPSRLACQLGAFEADEGLVLAGSAITLIDASGEVVGEQHFPEDDVAIRAVLPRENCFAQSSVMFRRHALERAGGYRSAFTHAEDYDLWLRLAELGRVRNFAKPLVQYRVHGGSNTSQNLELQVAAALAAQIAARARRDGRKEPFGQQQVTSENIKEHGVSDIELQSLVAAQYLALAVLGRSARTYEESCDLIARSRSAVAGLRGVDELVGRSYLAQVRLDLEFGRRSRAARSLVSALHVHPRLTRVIVVAAFRALRRRARLRSGLNPPGSSRHDLGRFRAGP